MHLYPPTGNILWKIYRFHKIISSYGKMLWYPPCGKMLWYPPMWKNDLVPPNTILLNSLIFVNGDEGADLENTQESLQVVTHVR